MPPLPRHPVALKMEVALGTGILAGGEREWYNQGIGVGRFAMVAWLGRFTSVAGQNVAMLGVLSPVAFMTTEPPHPSQPAPVSYDHSMKCAAARACLLLLWLLHGAYAQVVTPPAASIGNQPSESSPTVVNLPLPRLLKSIPQLRGLKAADDQLELPALLDKVGATAEALFHKMPSLIAHEEVLQSQGNIKPTRQDFEYLILSHHTEKDVTLDEYRVDLHPPTPSLGETYNPAAVLSGGVSIADLERLNLEANTNNKGAFPLSQGFANGWVYFYPSNRSQAAFRYLGRQRVNGHTDFVVAFAQLPASVQSPGELRFEGQTLPIYYQGIAWVEESDFHIEHLRTDLLAPLHALHLDRLTADIDFGETQVAQTDPLWLPQKVVIAVEASGQTFREQHSYSGYRTYVVRTRLLY